MQRILRARRRLAVLGVPLALAIACGAAVAVSVWDASSAVAQERRPTRQESQAITHVVRTAFRALGRRDASGFCKAATTAPFTPTHFRAWQPTCRRAFVSRYVKGAPRGRIEARVERIRIVGRRATATTKIIYGHRRRRATQQLQMVRDVGWKIVVDTS